MKRTMPNKKLVLSKETLRRLNGVELAGVAGATVATLASDCQIVLPKTPAVPGDHQIPLPGASGGCTYRGCSLQVGNCVPGSMFDAFCAAASQLVGYC